MTIFIYLFISLKSANICQQTKYPSHIKWAVVRTGGLGCLLHSNLQSIQWISKRTIHYIANI